MPALLPRAKLALAPSLSRRGKITLPYDGFEQGPIRPPSEAYSLLIRVTRNCPWNHCSFCPVYKQTRFSVRPVEHVIKDIDLIHKYVEILRGSVDETGSIKPEIIRKTREGVPTEDAAAYAAAFSWLFGGKMKSVFLQDANSLVTKPADLIEILLHLRKRFPAVERITSYARSRTVARKSDKDLAAIREAGLDRIHIGLESGSDEVLARVKKGSTKVIQVEAGQKAKKAGMEVSEYVIPGLGGRALSSAHATETADAINQIDPHYIRLRTLAIPPHAPLFEEYRAGRFDKCSDVMVVEEILAFIEALDGITSVLKSDHVLNLFMDLEGEFPRDKASMTALLRAFLDLEPHDQRLYQLGRRLGLLARMDDLGDPAKRGRVEHAQEVLGVTPDNLDEVTDRMMVKFI